MVIYKITNTVNGKVYIGKTIKTMEKRWVRHKSLSFKKKTPLYLALQKYGFESFLIEEIDKASTLEELNEKEKQWITHYQSKDREKGYNMTDGGDGGEQSPEILERVADMKRGKPLSKEHRENISKGLIGKTGHPISEETKNKISKSIIAKHISGEIKLPPSHMIGKCGEKHPFYGKTHSDEAKQKLSIARKGKTYEDLFTPEWIETRKIALKEQFSGENNPLYKEVPIEEVIRRLYENPDLLCQDLSKEYDVCATTLSQKIKKKTGHSFSALIQIIKNEKTSPN